MYKLMCNYRSMFNSRSSVINKWVKLTKCKWEISHENFKNKISTDSLSVPDDFKYRAIELSVIEKLKKANIVFEVGYTCIKLRNCVFCTESQVSSYCNNDLFINKRTGHFLCHKCKMFGSWCELEKIIAVHLKKSADTVADIKSCCTSYNMKSEWEEMVIDCEDLYSMGDENYRLILEKFGLFSCSKDLFEKLKVKADIKRNMLLFPISSEGTVAGYKTLDSCGKFSTFPKADCPGAFSFISRKKSTIVVIVSDVNDFLALGSLNLPYDIVCLPYGAAVLPQNLLPYFEPYEKVILWLGIRDGAWNASIQFAKKLKEKRCYLVRPTGNQLSAVSAISHNENVKLILSSAKPVWHQFVTSFSSLREDVVADIQNAYEIIGVSWSRFPGLNSILRGHRRGELTILTGTTGIGKTTFLSEYSLDLATKGVNTLWGSFEIKNSRLARIMLQQYSETPTIYNNRDLLNIWADKFEELPIYFLTLHGQQCIKTVMNAIEHCSYIYDIAHVVIDNIQFMIDVGKESNFGDRFWVQDYILQCFRRFATANNCHVTLVIHPRKEILGTNLNSNSIFGSAKASQEADNILILQQEMSSSMRSKKYLEVCKNRFTGDLGCINLTFNKSTLSFSQKHQRTTNFNESNITDNEDSLGIMRQSTS